LIFYFSIFFSNCICRNFTSKRLFREVIFRTTHFWGGFSSYILSVVVWGFLIEFHRKSLLEKSSSSKNPCTATKKNVIQHLNFYRLSVGGAFSKWDFCIIREEFGFYSNNLLQKISTMIIYTIAYLFSSPFAFRTFLSTQYQRKKKFLK
jgi:hypothetical protein